MTIDQPSEIPEATARGRTQEIYRDIRGCFRAPIVNLIYRRIAATPGCLEWAWGSVRPLVTSGDLERAAEGLVRSIDHPISTTISDDRLLSAGIDEDGLATVCRVLDTYNRSNPMNLIVVKVLHLALQANRPTVPFAFEKFTDVGAAQQPLPPLIDVATAGPEVREAMRRFAREASGGSDAIVPTLFRHFGAWPGFLDLAAEAIGPLTRTSALPETVGRLDQAANAVAGGLLRNSESPDEGIAPPTGASRAALSDVLDLFPTAIGGMIVIGWWLRGALPR